MAARPAEEPDAAQSPTAGGSRADTLRYLENRAAIQDLAILYAVSCDTAQLEATVDCWVAEGVFDESASGYGRYAGQAAIRTFFKEKVFANFKTTVHLTSNHHIAAIGPNSASGVVFVCVESIKHDGVRSRVQGCYHDDYTRTERGWRFQNRVFVATFPREIIATAS